MSNKKLIIMNILTIIAFIVVVSLGLSQSKGRQENLRNEPEEVEGDRNSMASPNALSRINLVFKDQISLVDSEKELLDINELEDLEETDEGLTDHMVTDDRSDDITNRSSPQITNPHRGANGMNGDIESTSEETISSDNNDDDIATGHKHDGNNGKETSDGNGGENDPEADNSNGSPENGDGYEHDDESENDSTDPEREADEEQNDDTTNETDHGENEDTTNHHEEADNNHDDNNIE